MDNSATATGGPYSGSGGGLTDCDGIIQNNTIKENSAGDGAGLLGCVGTIQNNIISGNFTTRANGHGGGLHQCHGIIQNNVICKNSAQGWGGGLYYCSDAIIQNNTICGNSGSYGGGLSRCIYGDTVIRNCILWGNTCTRDGAQIYHSEPIYFSCIEGWTGGGLGNINADPCFVQSGQWADANDPNVIVEPNDPNAIWVDGDYHLLRTSPCVDAGTDANVYTDIEGSVRPFDFPGVDNNGELPEFDMGAYELVPVEAGMKFTPQTLNCKSKGKWVKTHITLPEEIYPKDIDINEPAIAYPMGIESEYIKVFGTGPVRLEICFNREAFCDSITETGEIEITVIGSLTTSRYFYATNTIKIKPRR